MKKYYSSEFQGIKDKLNDDKNDINVNLWDLDGSSFFLDKNINNNSYLGSKETFINPNTEFNINNDNNNINLINLITSKNKKIENINFPNETNYKIENKFMNEKFIKGSVTPTPNDKKNLMKIKILKNNNVKKNKFKNNSFCQNSNGNYNINESLSKNDLKKQKIETALINKKNINIKAKKRMNSSVGYNSKKYDSSKSIIFGYNKLKKEYNYNKRKNLNKSLQIDDLNNHLDKNNYNNSNFEDKIIMNLKCNKYTSNNNKKIKKSNSIDNKIYKNKKNISNIKYLEKLSRNIPQRKRKENDIKKNKSKSVISKKSIEDAEKYTHYLANRKIFTHDYELQNKLRKQKDQIETEKEMSQCTFKPQLYNNKYNNRIQAKKNNNNKNSMYEKQSQWLDNIKKKNLNEREKKINKEIQECTFIPQLTNLPKYSNKNRTTIREQIVEENYYNNMKKARQIVQERNKGDDLVERYNERRRKKEMLPRSKITFEDFNNYVNNSNNPNEYNNLNYFGIKEAHSANNIFYDNDNDNINLDDYKNNNGKINENILNFNIINNNLIDDANINNNIINNYIYNNNINNNYIELNNNDKFINKNTSYIIYDNKNNNNNNSRIKSNNINKISNREKISNRNIENYNNIYNNNIISNNEDFMTKINLNDYRVNKTNKNISYNKYMNQRNKNNLNKIDLDKNFTEELFMNKIQLNDINNFRIIFPKIEEIEKENINISTEAGTKNSSSLSLQKKSTHSLQGKSDKNNNIMYNNNVNNLKISQISEFPQNKIIDNNNNDDEYNRQKKLLMNKLHNWKNFNEETDEDE